jgi:hypothetical protein
MPIPVLGPRATNAEEGENVMKYEIRQYRSGWFAVIVRDEPQAGHPTVPCHHTAGVYRSEAEALALVSELTR